MQKRGQSTYLFQVDMYSGPFVSVVIGPGLNFDILAPRGQKILSSAPDAGTVKNQAGEGANEEHGGYNCRNPD